jgi:hypothetical protein
VTALAFSPEDDNVVAVATKTGGLFVWELNFDPATKQKTRVSESASPTLTHTHTLTLALALTLNLAQRVKEFTEAHKGCAVTCLVWEQKGTKLYSADKDGKILATHLAQPSKVTSSCREIERERGSLFVCVCLCVWCER